MKKILSLLLVFLLSFSITGCSLEGLLSNENKTTIKNDIKNYVISTKDPYIEMNAGERIYLDYKLNFTLESGEYITFVSSDESVAKVLSTGYLLAKGKGSCTITLSYLDAVLVYQVTVNQKIELVAPLKTDYFTNEELDLTGAKIYLYNNDSTISDEIEVTSDMVTGFDTSSRGEKTVTVNYLGEELKFVINVVEREFESYYISSVNFDSNIKTNEKMEIKVINENLTGLKEKISSLYDYKKYKIVIDITTPNKKIDTVYSFLMEDYKESITNKTLDTSKVNEGIVNIKNGYNYKLTLTKNSDQYYMFRYYPTEVGKYSYVVKVYANESVLVQSLDGEFNVTKGNDSKGIVKVSSNNKTFEHENGETITFVGENLAWYTSKERRYKDYELWINSLKENGVNYVRIWLSAFEKALFWNDYTCYDSKLDEAYEMDKILELLEENGIYADITIFHHGMFSAKVNPMWPNNTNSWYTSKYGANPYSKLISDPKDYFTNDECLKWTENYLTYLASRYGYSTNILSYEIFNEVDWVEAYETTTGNAWHDRMAKLLKKIDFRGHMVTTSVKGDDFTSSIYSVFKLDSIDYVNVHNYGTYNYLTYIPKKVATAYQTFNKPIIYQEVGYGGNSGADQLEKDPNDVTLHQELWAGLMSSGASGMNWWWDSWIEKNNSYSKFKGPGKFKDLIDLRGTNFSLAYGNSNVSNTNTKITTLGYIVDNRCYLYLFSTDYKLSNTNASFTTTLKIKNLASGSYEVKFYDTYTGEVIKTSSVSTIGTTLSVSVNGTNDIAIIINKK